MEKRREFGRTPRCVRGDFVEQSDRPGGEPGAIGLLRFLIRRLRPASERDAPHRCDPRRG